MMEVREEGRKRGGKKVKRKEGHCTRYYFSHLYKTVKIRKNVFTYKLF